LAASSPEQQDQTQIYFPEYSRKNPKNHQQPGLHEFAGMMDDSNQDVLMESKNHV